MAQVSVYGGVEQQVTVAVDPSRASGYGLSNSYISQILAAENLLYPGGDMNNGSKTLTVTTDAKFQTVDEVANLILPLPTGGNVRLNEVADVYLDTNDPDTIAKMGDTACVILQVSKQSGGNEVAVSNAVEKRLTELKEENNAVNYEIAYIASEYINLSVDNAMQNIVMGVVLAAIVVFIFLRRFGATMTISISMPVCILAVFALMKCVRPDAEHDVPGRYCHGRGHDCR